MVNLNKLNKCNRCNETSTPVFSQLVHEIGFPGGEPAHNVKVIEGTTVTK